MKRQQNSLHCFVCGVSNSGGVRAVFYDSVDDGNGSEVLTYFTGRTEHQGYPDRMHGGIATAILDEAIGRALNSSRTDDEGSLWGVAIDLSVRFRKPVPLGVELTARGRLTTQPRRLFEGSGELYLPDGQIAMSATGRYMRIPPDEISEIDPHTLGWRVYSDEELGIDVRAETPP